MTGELVYVNAGHNPPLLYRADEDKFVEFTKTGMVAGLFEDVVFEQLTVRLNPDDFMFLYTDGVTEAMDADRNEFGEQRLRQVLLDHRNSPAIDIAEALDRALTLFTSAAAPSEDITFVVVKRT